MSWKWLLLTSLLLIVYLVIGGVVLHFIEQPNETTSKATNIKFNQDFLQNFTCVTKEQVKELIKVIVKGYEAGVITPDGEESSVSNWDIPSAILFAITVVTTIGYGNITPITWGGKLFSVLYALVGIPVAGIFLAGIGGKLKSAKTRLISFYENKRLISSRKRGHSAAATLSVLTGVGLLIMIPAGIFHGIEKWSYGDSVYYSFITLTTIGFGDYVAGANDESEYRGIYRLCVGVWIFIGLSWMALLVADLSELLSWSFEKTSVAENSKEEKPKDHRNGLENDGFEGNNELTEVK